MSWCGGCGDKVCHGGVGGMTKFVMVQWAGFTICLGGVGGVTKVVMVGLVG